MADVILFRPKFFNADVRPLPAPWGLLYVGSSLTSKGYSVKIIDELLHTDWRKQVLEEIEKKPTFFGVTSMTGRQIKHGLEFSGFVKKYSNIPVVWGGIHPSLFPEQTLRHETIDYIVKGEGEETVIELLDHLKNKSKVEKIRGLGYKKNNQIFLNQNRPFPQLDDLPDINFSLIDVNRYTGKRFGSRRSFELCTSRGCPHRCAFCYNVHYYRCTWRTKSIDRIFKALHTLIDTYDIDGLTWREDNFFVDKKRVQKIADRIVKENISIKWHADCRIDYVYFYENSFMELLKKSGCHTLTFGAESGSNTILESINKGITREQILEVKKKMSKHHVYQNYHFMMGLPDETEEDINKTIDLMYLLMKNNPYFGEICGPSLYTPYPGTALYEKSLAKGFEPPQSLEGWINMDWYALNLPWIQDKRRKTVEDIAWNVLGMRQKKLRFYFKWKFFLLAKYHLLIPCFERNIYLRLKKGKDKGGDLKPGS
ncbi:MAG: B12-binding domain-containing radical SAM protein [Candidatus Aminicenantes bacterium]|nr:B12-binding domain-containing radical SAM protein [Candidatus Aminicenantes bacterium]